MTRWRLVRWRWMVARQRQHLSRPASVVKVVRMAYRKRWLDFYLAWGLALALVLAVVIACLLAPDVRP